MNDEIEAIRVYLARIGKKGGQARAAKHTKQQLSEWARKGGRPKKSTGPRVNVNGKEK